MKSEIYGRENDKDLLLLLGWGNRLDNHNLMWLVDLITGAEFRAHVFELPIVITDFNREYLEPVKKYQETLGAHVLFSHSTGGLIAAYLTGQRKTIYLSPWWGMFGAKLRKTTLKITSKIGLGTSFISIDFTKEELGDLVTDNDWGFVPKRVAPAWLREIMKAQQNMPPLQENNVVFCSLKDTIVSLKAIGERTSNVVIYYGGHELFSSSNRELYREALLNALLG